jgi:hypothetical protein
MKIQTKEITEKLVEVEFQLPIFRKDGNRLFKIYEQDGKAVYDYVFFGYAGYVSYQHNFGAITNSMLSLPEITIEDYAQALAKFADLVANDIESLYEDKPIEKTEPNIPVPESQIA